MSFNRYSTVRQVLDDPKAREVLLRHLPGALTHPDLGMAMDMSLASVAGYPESGLTPATFEALVRDLEKLPG
ncbi:MAG: hypothetical protein JXR83_04855 [Deltaproteobacteria bacterium]|nr:hypothetical protein [Deltaproteobacteria bacterium]